MLKHPTLDQLNALGLHGMAKAFVEIAANGQANGLGHHEWLGLLLDREASWRQDKRFAARLRVAKLRQQASVEDVDYRKPPAVLTARCSKAGRGRVDQRPRQFGPRRSDGRRQKFAGLSAWPQSLSRQSWSVIYQRVPVCSEDLSRLAAATGAIPASYATSAEPTFSSSMIGGLSRSTPPRGMISWKSSKSAMDAAPQ